MVCESDFDLKLHKSFFLVNDNNNFGKSVKSAQICEISRAIVTHNKTIGVGCSGY